MVVVFLSLDMLSPSLDVNHDYEEYCHVAESFCRMLPLSSKRLAATLINTRI
jgi:hypothetical protein